MTERVAILGGTGALGRGLAARLGRAGVAVTIGSRDRARADEAARVMDARLGGVGVRGAALADAVPGATVVVLAVPYANQIPTIDAVRDGIVDGALVLDCTVPLAVAVGGRPSALLRPWEGSAAEQARARLPDRVAVAAALHSVSAAGLDDLDAALDEDTFVCGDRAARARAIALLARVEGLRPVDAGPLSSARHVEALTPLLIGINARHGVHAGLRVTGLPA